MKVSCPHCKRIAEYEGNPFRPFCCERCRLIDLGAWIEEKYSVPVSHETGSALELAEEADHESPLD